MKRKQSNKKINVRASSARIAVPAAMKKSPNTDGGEAALVPIRVGVTHQEFPPPDFLLNEARKEVNRKLIESYIHTIRLLRHDKGFSFREIADWLTENGVEADYNAVYRVYTKGLPEGDVADLDQTPIED